MGIIIGKFRKKKSTIEVLEKLENEIQTIEKFRRSTEQMQKKMVGRFIFISICGYCIIAFVLYFYFFPVSAYDRAIYVIPLILLPVLIIFIKKVLSWYYNRKIRKNQKKLSTLKDEKKKILEEVMDKETYKVAKDILEKFAPDQIKKNNVNIESTPMKSLTPYSQNNRPQTGLRYRGPLQQVGKVNVPPNTPSGQLAIQTATPMPTRLSMSQSIVPHFGPVPSLSGTPLLSLPRAILPRDRTVLDKMVDYLVGDGPSNRYALICKNCSSHNGMALKEEFDYLSFKCCYCLTFNPSPKKRPSAPKLEISFPNKKSDVSETDSNSDSDAEGPIITEPPNEDEGEEIDYDKLYDLDHKSSDTESSAMEVEPIKKPSENETVEKEEAMQQD